MWFRNLQIYRLDPAWQMAPGTLETALVKQSLQPCTGLTLETRGWLPVRDSGERVYASGRQMLLSFGVEKKLLPASIVKQAAHEQAIKLETAQGFKPGRKQLRDLHERMTVELLPRAFARRQVTRGWIDTDGGWIVVDASAPTRAEEFVKALREALGDLPAHPLDCQQSAQAAMTAWLTTKNAPGAFEIDHECQLVGDGEEQATVAYLRHSLTGNEIRKHIDGGKRATRLGLVWNGQLSLVLAEPLHVRKLKFLDVEKTREESEASGLDGDFDADFALMSGTLARLLVELVAALGGEASAG